MEPVLGAVSICAIAASIACIIYRIRNLKEPTRIKPESCYICCENSADTALIPCGHGGVCHTCTYRLLDTDRRCPLCRQAVCGVLFCFNDVDLHPAMLSFAENDEVRILIQHD